MNKKKWIKRLLITLAVLLCGFAIFEIIVHVLMDSEMSSRDDWNIQLGERMYASEERGVSLYSAPCEASIPVSRMVPDEYEEDGFTYYDESVQHRLGQELMELVQQQGNAAIDAPLALLNPLLEPGATGSSSPSRRTGKAKSAIPSTPPAQNCLTIPQQRRAWGTSSSAGSTASCWWVSSRARPRR